MACNISRWTLLPLFRFQGHVFAQRRTISVDYIRQKSLAKDFRERTQTATSLLPHPPDTRQESARLTPLIRQMNEHAKRRDAAGAHELLGQVEHPNLALCNAALNVCAKACDFEVGWDVWASMPEKDLVSYNTMISLCGSAKRMQRADELWEELLQAGLEPNIITYTSMIKSCGQCGDVDKALHMFDSLKSACSPDEFAFAAAMAVCARVGDYARTRQLFVEMIDAGIDPNHYHVNSMLTSCVDSCDSGTAQAIFEMMPAYKLQPRVEDYTTLLSCCRHDIKRCREIWDDMRRANLQPNKFTVEKMVWTERKYGSQENAALLFKEFRTDHKYNQLTPRLRKYADELGDS